MTNNNVQLKSKNFVENDDGVKKNYVKRFIILYRLE